MSGELQGKVMLDALRAISDLKLPPASALAAQALDEVARIGAERAQIKASKGGVTVTEQPSDRLTRLCLVMTDALDAAEGSDGVKALVMLDDEARGGVQAHGYDDLREPLVNLFMHLRAMMKANGHDVTFMPLPGDPRLQ